MGSRVVERIKFFYRLVIPHRIIRVQQVKVYSNVS